MKIKDKETWELGLKNNRDPYGSCGYRYVQRWAELMEKHIDVGQKLEDIWEQDSKIADTEGITGFMYGCAVSVLKQVWIYGDELAVLHNKSLGGTGEEKGVLNPAVWILNEKSDEL